LPFSQIAANSESIPRRGFFGIHASIAQWLPNAPTLRQGELALPDISEEKFNTNCWVSQFFWCPNFFERCAVRA
jgi:hypothetical protein